VLYHKINVKNLIKHDRSDRVGSDMNRVVKFCHPYKTHSLCYLPKTSTFHLFHPTYWMLIYFDIIICNYG
jgi:hypothetical protein